MKKFKIGKINAAFLTLILITSMLILPMSGAFKISTNETYERENINKSLVYIRENNDPNEPIWLDTNYIPKGETLLADEQNDIGYNMDTGNRIQKGLPVYVGEPVDQSIPGRGRTGTLDPTDDEDDWYVFSVCEGQTIQASLSSSDNYDFELCNTVGSPVGKSYTADITGKYFIHVFASEDAGSSEYTFSLTLNGQNDIGSGGDAGDDIGSVTPISPGSYNGYMDVDDVEDWYSFNVNSGQGIFVTVNPMEKSDYDIHLYTPSGELVHSAQYYGNDELEYPADISGMWSIKLDMFPGWDTGKWPDNYFLYGSGVYDLELSIGGSAEAPPDPIPQPEITPIAQTFIVNDDPNSNKDEYGYLAAIPAANYFEGGKKYVSPIIYKNVGFIPTWFTSVDQTTQYLIDDWDTYLERHNIAAKEFTILPEPIQAAADIAINKWTSSDTAVLAVDGSIFEDEITIIVDADKTISSSPDITIIQPGDFKDIGILNAKPMFIGPKWGAIHLFGKGDNFAGDTGIITPRYEGVMEDWWPFPYDDKGEDIDTFYPVSLPGIWMPYVTDESGLEELQVIKYSGDRYTIPVSSTDCSIEVTISTDEPSNLIVYLIDPNGNVRRPMAPHHNGGEIKPIHQWNGGHWEHDQDEFRTWIIEPHADFSVNVHNAMEGKWTVIVVPYLNSDLEEVGYNGEYHIIINMREYNPSRIDAALSASNAAVIASAQHAPLLYVNEDSVPSETSNVLTQLGVTDIIFVNINGVSSASPSGSINEYSTMKEVIDAIKADSNSENFITITSLGTGDGYFAPAAMIAAYHISPVLNIGEASEAYNTLDMIAAWREYAGDYYHGCRSVGHLPDMDHPFDFKEFIQGILQSEFPSAGFDLKLRWFSDVYNGIHDLAANYDLDKQGKEAYLFVSPRDTDIRGGVCRAMTGNNSYAGHIPLETPAFSSALICRDILYPAIIFSNPGRNVTSSCFMNFRSGQDWFTNDGQPKPTFTTEEMKVNGFSHGRFYEGHTTWEGLLERYNEGCSFMYHCSHGTGGSGICCMYKNVEEQFPLADPSQENLKDKDWWDGWRGYYYDNARTNTPRSGGLVWLNSEEPNLYDFVHFKWCDQLFENLHSQFNLWMSCTTAEHLGPIVYLGHGAALYYGNSGTGLSPQCELLDYQAFGDMLQRGYSIGEAHSNYIWLHQRDYTTGDPTTIYGGSSLKLTNVHVILGDPTMTIYSPEWNEPVPIET